MHHFSPKILFQTNKISLVREYFNVTVKRILFLFHGRYSYYLIRFLFPSVMIRWKVRNVESDIINNSIMDLIIPRNEYGLHHFSISKQAKQKLFIKVKHLQIHESGEKKNRMENIFITSAV